LKQVLQNYKTGELRLVEVPAPTHARRAQVLVATRASLVSVGTEKYMLELAQKSLLGKALARPDLVRQVIAKAQAEGILEAWRQASGHRPGASGPDRHPAPQCRRLPRYRDGH